MLYTLIFWFITHGYESYEKPEPCFLWRSISIVSFTGRKSFITWTLLCHGIKNKQKYCRTLYFVVNHSNKVRALKRIEPEKTMYCFRE